MDKPSPNGLHPDLQPIWHMFEFVVHRLDQFDVRLDERDRHTDNRFTKLWAVVASGLVMMVVALLGVLLV